MKYLLCLRWHKCRVHTAQALSRLIHNKISVSFCIVLNSYLIREIVLILLKTIFSRNWMIFLRFYNSYMHMRSNITIVIEHDDNFDISSLKFLPPIR